MFEFKDPKMIMKVAVWSNSAEDTAWYDAIPFQGGIWFAPEWIDGPYPNTQKPVRLIRMDALPHKVLGDLLDDGHRRYSLDGPIPKAVLAGATSLQSGQRYEVVENPELFVRR
jgi:hypothetical protein